MAKIFLWNEGQSGTLIDSVSGIQGTLSSGSFKKTEKGLAMLFDGSATDLDSNITLTGVKTIIMFIKPSANTKLLLDDGADKLEITGGSYSGTGLTQNYVYVENIGETDTNVATLNQWQCSISEFSAGIDFTTDLEVTPTAKTYVVRIICLDTILTVNERNKYNIAFLNSYSPSEQKRNFTYCKINDLSNSIYSPAYNMILSPDSVMVDITNGGDNFIIAGGNITRGDDMLFLTDQSVGNLGNKKSILIRLKINNAATGDLFTYAAGAVNITSTTLSSSEFSGIYVNGLETGIIGSGYQTFVLINATNVNLDTFVIKSSKEVEIVDLKFSTTELTITQIKAYHNSFRKPILIDTFKDAAVGDTETIEWQTVSGTGAIEERTTQDTILKDLIIGTKYWKQGTAGVRATQSKQVYGEIIFDADKGGASNAISITFSNIANVYNIAGANGYLFQLLGSERIAFFRFTNGAIVGSALFYTAVSYIDINTDYRIKIVRLENPNIFLDIPTLQTSDCVNNNYDTFTGGNRYGFTAIKTSTGAFVSCGTADEIAYTNTESYLVEFDCVLNGDAPTVRFARSLTGAPKSNTATIVNGFNSIILTVIESNTGVLQFRNVSGDLVNFTIYGLQVRQVYDANTFWIGIKGGSFVPDTDAKNGFTTVDTTGGFGSNPVTDSTYTTSEFLVTDLDANDMFWNLKEYNQPKI